MHNDTDKHADSNRWFVSKSNRPSEGSRRMARGEKSIGLKISERFGSGKLGRL